MNHKKESSVYLSTPKQGYLRDGIMISNSIYSIFDKGMKIILKSAFVIVASSIIFLTLLITTDVIMRSLFNLGVKGSTEFCSYILVFIAFFSVVGAQEFGNHTAVSFLRDRLPERKSLFLHKINTFIMLFVSLLFTYAGAKKAISAYLAAESEWFGSYIFPVWGFRIIFPIAFFIMCLLFLRDLIPSPKK